MCKDDSYTERYIKYKLVGFDEIEINNNYKFELNTKLFKSILISKDVKYLTVELQDGITLGEYNDEILVYLNHICFNLIIHTEAELNSPVRILEIIKDGSNMEFHDRISIKDEIKIVRGVPASAFYEKIVNSQTAMEKHFLLYERIFKTLHNPNKVVQFLSLYEFLMELLSKGKKRVEQRNVVEYITNNKDKYSFIDFKPTRRKGKNFEEDRFTYIRNEISHCEDTNDLSMYRELGSQINDNLIKKIIIVLNDVISAM